MKTATIAAFATPVLCGLLVALPTASGAKPSTTITVPFFDVDFVIEAYDAGDDTTYEVTFTDFGFESVYEFDHDGVVTAITAENERYKMIYKKKNGKLKKVKLVSSRRQLGDPREGTNNMDVDQTTPSGRHSVELAPAGSRRLGECGDCTYMWDTLCDQGVETVCDLEGYGNPFSSTAETSIQVFCDSFEKLCKRNTADGVCEGECGGNECLPPLTIKLEHTGGFGEEATLVDLFVVQPGGQTAYFDNAETETGDLYAEDNKVSYTMFEGLEEEDVTGEYIAFARWYTGETFASYTMTATTGSGDVLFSQEGRFNDCGPSNSFDEDGFIAQGTTVMVPFILDEYVDNRCD